MMLAAFTQFMKRKRNKTEEDLQFLASYKKHMDFMEQNSLLPLIEYVKSLP